METAIQTVVKVFLKGAKGKESLGKKEFQNLVSSQLGNILSGADSKDAVSEMCQGLDTNSDGKVGFEEYMKLVGYLACSLSEQKVASNEEPAQNAATGQVAQSAPNNTEEQPKENAEAKEEAKPEANEAAKEEAKADATVEVKVEAKAEGEKTPEAAKEEARAAATAEAAAAAEVKVAEKEPEKAEETAKVEEAAEKSPAAAEEEGEKKTEEATS
ncbi:S100 calcium binding protein U [Kryptolebias marmoratus]|uniref:S100 calcium binding protein U n=1 Tax=Kryptolebias marmoratus TaxID=37003 RepID=A0A3Q3AET3_KRYMA|nr:S100 calcium binding protein U [Kryptolebias marmoratus]